MTDFDYENHQKKVTARSAVHRKGGSKSRRCSLPSDHLTEAQKRKLNGPMQSVNLNQPMPWSVFRGLSDSLKKTYLTNLLNTYKPSGKMLGEMFGCTGRTVVMELHRLGLPVGKPGGQPTKAATQAWAAFCNGVVGGGNNIISEANDRIEPENEVIEKRVWDLDSPDHVNACRSEEPQVTCYDPVAEAEERAKERLVDLMEQGVSLHTEAEAAEPATVGESVMTSLDARFEGDADDIGWQLRNMMNQLFSGDRVKVKLSVEVCE